MGSEIVGNLYPFFRGVGGGGKVSRNFQWVASNATNLKTHTEIMLVSACHMIQLFCTMQATKTSTQAFPVINMTSSVLHILF